MSVDFSKAFNRIDHQSCLDRLQEKGPHEHFLFCITLEILSGKASRLPASVRRVPDPEIGEERPPEMDLTGEEESQFEDASLSEEWAAVKEEFNFFRRRRT